ncbi:MAG: DUF2203 domain-containing protein [Bryobacteraceae bacterium]|jgi:hypothetical protein
MPRFFTLEQAEKVLPKVEVAIREAVVLKTAYETLEGEWQMFSERLAVTGGMRVDRAQVAEQKNRREETAVGLKQAIEKVHEFGCLVKDLDIGLIDFPTLFQGEEVYLCWKLGEPGIQFWHGVDEGFRGRKPIDAGFLQHHRGELPN